MKLEQLTDIFVKQLGARKDGTAYVLPDTSEATLFVALPGETLTIQRISRIELSDGLLFADTHKGDRVMVAADDVRAVKLEKTDGTRRERQAGFSK